MIPLEVEPLVHERVQLGQQGDEVLERLRSARIEFGADGRQLDHARQALGDAGARGVRVSVDGSRLSSSARISVRRSAPRRLP